MKEIKGNIIAGITSDVHTVILHGCNCFHTMGAGVAKTLVNVFPEILKEDRKTVYGDHAKMGTIGIVQVLPTITIINCYTQFKYGTAERQVNYEAVYRCLQKVARLVKGKNISLRAPRLGCGLAGGNWEVVKTMFEALLPDINIYYL